MKLWVQELDSELNNTFSQEFTMDHNTNLVAIRPHIYKHNSPSGDLKVEILDANGLLIDTSNTVTITSISAVAFFHGLVKFDIDTPLFKDRVYKLSVKAFNGYTFSESAFAGVCLDFDLRRGTASYANPDSLRSSMDFEIWERI